MVNKLVVNFNGITMAYAMALVNAVLGLVLAYGVDVTVAQQAAITTLANALFVIVAHVGHRLGEATNSGSATAVSVAKQAAAEQHATPEGTSSAVSGA